MYALETVNKNETEIDTMFEHFRMTFKPMPVKIKIKDSWIKN